MLPRIQRTIFPLLLGAIFAVGMASRHAVAADAATLRLDWTALGYHAPFYLALQRGYYKEQGLDLTILEGKGSSAGVSLVANGNDTFAFADAATAAKMISNGVPVRVVMGLVQHSPLAIVFPTDRNIHGPQDLKGKTIASCASTGGAALMPAYLKAVKLAASDVTLVNTDCSAYFQLVAQGKADASISYFPQAKSILHGLGTDNIDRLLFWDAGVTLPSHGIVASTKTIQSDPQLIRRFVIATAKGWRDAEKDPAAAVNALVASFPLLKGKEATLTQELSETLKFVAASDTPGKGFGWQSPENWKSAEAILVEYMGMKPAASSEVYFTNQFIP